jgi:hypothetical protein
MQRDLEALCAAGYQRWRSTKAEVAEGAQADEAMLDEIWQRYEHLARPATVEEIATLLLTMLGSFAAAGGNRELQVVGATMLEDVGATNPTWLALDWTCRKLRRKWRPSYGRMCPCTAEVLEVLDEAHMRIGCAVSVFHEFYRIILDAAKGDGDKVRFEWSCGRGDLDYDTTRAMSWNDWWIPEPEPPAKARKDSER